MAESLRDQLSKAYDEVVEKDTPVETPAQAEQETASPAKDSTSDEKPGRTAGRARDEQGRLLPGKAVREEHAAEPKAPPAQSNAQAALEAPAAPLLKPLQRPSSWKKEMWPLWDKLSKGEPLTPEEARQKAEYILQRESDYAKGVSTYKAEFDQAKPLVEAVAPYRELLQQHGIEPASHVRALLEAHKVLALGNPQQKLVSFAKLIQDYQVPIEQLFVQGQDGKIYFNQQLMAQAQQQPQQRQPQPDVRQLVQATLAEERARAEAAAMESDTSKYPHFEELKADMAGLLQAGLAQDLPSAYDKALRMHDDLFEAQQQAKRQAEEATRLEAQRKTTEAARRNQISAKSATPASSGSQSPKGRRAQIEEAYDEHLGGSRV